MLWALSASAGEWRGLVPLRSTRTDVERLLGPQQQPGQVGIYRTEREQINVTYSVRPCDYGWQVPLGTVISIFVHPLHPPKLDDFKLDESRFEKRRDVHIESLYYYANTQEGINYTVDVGQGVVTGIEYYPSAKDNNLRCPSSADLTGGIKTTSKFDEYAGNTTAEKRKLDQFARSLRQYTANQGYVMVYAGRRTRRNEAGVIAGRIKNYLVKIKGVDPKRLVVIEAGHRARVTVELYLVPPGAPPPLSAEPDMKTEGGVPD